MIELLLIIVFTSLSSSLFGGGGWSGSPGWTMVGNIISFIFATIVIAVFTFMFMGIFADSLDNEYMGGISLIIGVVIWLLVGRSIFRKKTVSSNYTPIHSFGLVGLLLSWLFGTVKGSPQGGMLSTVPLSSVPSVPSPSTASASTSSTSSSSSSSGFQIRQLTLNEKVEYMDIGDKNGVVLTFMDRSIIKIELKNLAKIVHELIRDFRKNQFSPGELSNHFTYLRDTYRSALPPSEYRQLMEILERFVTEGGSAEIV